MANSALHVLNALEEEVGQLLTKKSCLSHSLTTLAMGHGELQIHYARQSDVVAVRTAAQLTSTTVEFTADPSLSPGHELLYLSSVRSCCSYVQRVAGKREYNML